MRLPALLAPFCAMTLMAAPALADSPSIKPVKPAEQIMPKGQEAGIYRFGGTYSVTVGDSASTCQASCADDGMCVAWSYVATFEGTEARCELKRGGGKAMRNPLATSGVSPQVAAKFFPEPKPELDGAPETD